MRSKRTAARHTQGVNRTCHGSNALTTACKKNLHYSDIASSRVVGSRQGIETWEPQTDECQMLLTITPRALSLHEPPSGRS